MAADDFFSRWSKKKMEPQEAAPAADGLPDASANVPAEPAPLPTIDDVQRLTPDSDYTTFMAKGVDENVRRSAMKKLFTDPHFNIMDGLDIYIDDYSKPDPLPPGMLEMLNHAKSLLDPLKHLESPAMRMIGKGDQVNPAPVDETAGAKQENLEASAAGDQSDTANNAPVGNADEVEPTIPVVQPQTPDLPGDAPTSPVSTSMPASDRDSAGGPVEPHNEGAPKTHLDRTS